MCGVNMPSANQRRQLGAFGESAARAYLIRQGYTLLAANWRCRAGELDLIARTGDQVVFVEVRTRRCGSAGTPEESLTPQKRERLARLAWHYFASQGIEDPPPWRIDLIAIEVDHAGRIARLEHLPYSIEE